MQTRAIARIFVIAFAVGYLATFGVGFISSRTTYFDLLMDLLCPVSNLFKTPWSWPVILGAIAPLDGLFYATLAAALYLIFRRLASDRE